MHHAAKYAAPVLLALLLSACNANSVSAPVSQSPLGGTNMAQSSQSRALSSYEIWIQGAHGQMERAHIFKTRGAPQPAASGNLNYGGGKIQAKPVIFVVYWQFGTYGDPSGEQADLHGFYGGVGGSSWLNSVTQYYGPVGTYISNPTGQLAGEWVDNTDKLPRHLGTSAIANEALVAVAHFGYNFNASYVIATPHGHNTSGFGTQFCAWHSSESSSGGPVAFTNMPYITDAGASCGANFNGLGSNAGITIVGGHELAETQTDPTPSSGWVDSSGAENGDKCAWISSGQGAATDITLSTGVYAVQSLWSNAFNGGSGGCVISYP